MSKTTAGPHAGTADAGGRRVRSGSSGGHPAAGTDTTTGHGPAGADATTGHGPAGAGTAPGSGFRPGDPDRGDDARPMAGRRAQAARNDAAILTAARDVFLDDPKAPVAAVAERAGVGMSALYRRYPGKEDLLRKLCHDGLRRFNAEAETAAENPDGWAALEAFLTGVVEADVHSLTVHLAGTFAPTPQMRADAERSGALVTDLVRRAHASGRLRTDLVAEDIGLLLESCSAIRVPDPARTRQLRRRHLRLLLDGMATGNETGLPGPPPAADELNWRWRRR